MTIKPCAYCLQRPSLSADTVNPNPPGQGVGLGTCWTLACECGRGSSSPVSYDDAVERWNAQADDRQLAASSAQSKESWLKVGSWREFAPDQRRELYFGSAVLPLPPDATAARVSEMGKHCLLIEVSAPWKPTPEERASLQAAFDREFGRTTPEDEDE